MNKKKLVSILLIITVLITTVISTGIVAADSNVKINLFGEEVTLPDGYGEPFIDPDTSRTLVPARGIFEAMDATVEWIAETRTVVIKNTTDEIKVTIDSTTAYKNNEAVTLDQPAVIVADRTYVPLRFIAESLNLEVGFDGATTTVIIKKKEEAKVELLAGVYEIGKDLEAAEYLFVAEAGAEAGTVKVKLLRDKDSNVAENVISTIDFKNSAYVSLIGCEYIEAVKCKIYSMNAIPARAEGGAYKNGMFKVGKDLEKGSYKVKKLTTTAAASYKIYKTPFSTAGTNTVVSEAAVTTEKTITLTDGQYIILDNAQITKVQATVSGGSIGGGGGGGGGGGSSHRPDNDRPAPTATPEPTTTPGESTPEPTEEPTPEPTEEPTLPPISENEYYEGLEEEVYDFGFFAQLPCIEKIEDDEAGIIVYSYDISTLGDYENVEFDEFKTFVSKMHNDLGFGIEVFFGEKKNECHLRNLTTGVNVDLKPNDNILVVTITVGNDNSDYGD